MLKNVGGMKRMPIKFIQNHFVIPMATESAI